MRFERPLISSLGMLPCGKVLHCIENLTIQFKCQRFSFFERTIFNKFVNVTLGNQKLDYKIDSRIGKTRTMDLKQNWFRPCYTGTRWHKAESKNRFFSKTTVLKLKFPELVFQEKSHIEQQQHINQDELRKPFKSQDRLFTNCYNCVRVS